MKSVRTETEPVTKTAYRPVMLRSHLRVRCDDTDQEGDPCRLRQKDTELEVEWHTKTCTEGRFRERVAKNIFSG